MAKWAEANDRDAGREPCPDRIIDDFGGAFGMGCIGGFLWHFGKGMYNSPKGDRFVTAMFQAKARGPILGGNFAVWGGTFSTFDCTLQYLRHKDDHWNAIASGFLTGGTLAARGGWKSAGRNALFGGILLAVIEGCMALVMRNTAVTPRDQQLQMLEMEKDEQRRRELAERSRGNGESSGGMYASWQRFWEPVGERDTATKSTESSSSGFVSDEQVDKLFEKR